MITALKTALFSVGKTVLLAVVSEAVMKKVVILGLEELSKKTDNKVDDQIVEEIKKALK